MILRYTLVADGSSDQLPMHVIDWLIAFHRPDLAVTGSFARDLGRVGSRLSDRLPAALTLYPCDMLFVHRDTEGVAIAERVREIDEAARPLHSHWVPVVPARMTEAWLLSDEIAIRAVAENKYGHVRLDLPPKREWETVINPKQVLFDALVLASGKTRRAQARFSLPKARAMVAAWTTDFSPLRGLASFDALETSLLNVLMDF
ncbi:hypothetical protein [Massilia sp. TSP1-1-2]|uniref:hypothetical protein n=1 Tax=Massilia sp. TSP1-1-2 TaxID=2804649 RepID=UPI003CE72B9C